MLWHESTLTTSYIQDNLQLKPEENDLITNTASFTNCAFTNNSSPAGGSAVSLVSNLRVDQVVASVDFTNWYCL